MIASHVKAVLSRATPFTLQDFRNAFHLFDSWHLAPQRFGVVEPLRTKWGSEKEFLDLCHREVTKHFGTVIVQRKKPEYLFNFVIKFGPNSKCHSLWLDYVNPNEFGGERCCTVIDFLDGIFDALNMDYGFLCSYGEYDAKNLLHNVPVSSTEIQVLKVLGMEWPDCIPGFYWCNYFGEIYFRQGFGTRLLEFDGTHRLKSGVRIMKIGDVANWNSPEGLASENRFVDILGANWFFSKETGMPEKSLLTNKSLFSTPPKA